MTGYLGPLEINLQTKEPFLRLRKHPNVIITPPRQSDVPHIVPPLNDERVYARLDNPIHPYLAEHAQAWVDRIKPECDLGLKELIAGVPKCGHIVLTHSPVRFLREIQEDGSEIFLGDIGLFRCSKILLEDSRQDSATNLALPAGNRDIIWTIGDWLVPSHHRRGIMTDALDTLINDIGRPLLKSQHFIAMAYTDNEASGKVFLRNGFNVVRRIQNYAEVQGVMRDLNVFERYDTYKSVT